MEMEASAEGGHGRGRPEQREARAEGDHSRGRLQVERLQMGRVSFYLMVRVKLPPLPLQPLRCFRDMCGSNVPLALLAVPIYIVPSRHRGLLAMSRLDGPNSVNGRSIYP